MMVSGPVKPTRATLRDIADSGAFESFEESLEELGFTVRTCTQVAELRAIPWTGT